MSKKRFISLILFFIILSTSLVPLKPVQAEGSKKIEVGNSVQEGLSKEKEKELLGKLEKVKGELKDQKKEYDDYIKDFREEFNAKINTQAESYLKKVGTEEAKEGEAKVREITVSEDGDIKTIQEALDIASKNIMINKIKIKPGIYKEELILARSMGQLTIEGEEGVFVEGRITLVGTGKNLISVKMNDIVFDGGIMEIPPEATREDLTIGVAGGNISLVLNNIEIKNHYYPLVIDSPGTGSGLKIDKANIHNNILPMMVFNSNTDISELSYKNNMSGLNFISDKHLLDHQRLSFNIKNSEISNNDLIIPLHSGSIINIDNITGQISNLDISSNTIYNENDNGVKSLFSISGDPDMDRNYKLYVTDTKIKNNKASESGEFDSFIVASDMDLQFARIDLGGNSLNHNLIFDSNIGLKNIKQGKDEESRGIKYFIESYGMGNGELNHKLSVDGMEIYNKDDSERITESIIIGMDVELKNININSHDKKDRSILFIRESLLDLYNIDINESGEFLVDITEPANIPYKINAIKKIKINLKDSLNSSNNKLSLTTEDGIYQFEDVEIKKESFNKDSIINLKSDLLGYKDIVLENTGPFITDLSSRSAKEKSLNQLFMENIKINNKIPSNQNHDLNPLVILGEEDINLKLKNISISGKGDIEGYLKLENLGKIDIYQLKGVGHDVFSALDLKDIKEVNFYNSTLDNRNPVLSVYPNIDLNRTQVNMYNTIFLAKGLDKVVMDNSKVEFKNSNLLEDLSQVHPNFVNDDSNIFGEPELDDIGYPKEGSIVIDKGNNDYAKDLIKDLAGKDRIVNDIVDLGVYEYNPEDLIDPENPPVDPPIDPEKPPIEPENPIDPEDPPVDPDPLPVDPPEIKGEHKLYMEGFDDSSLRPNADITRHETAIVLYRILDSKIIDENYTEKADFKDIGPNHWGQDYIATLVKIGIIEGRTNNTFDPKKPITRAEFAKMLYEFDQVQKNEFKETNKDFTDIEGHWAEKYIKEMARKGWIEGYDDASFRPNKPISRIEVMIMVNRILNRKVDLENTLDGVKKFTDVDKNYKYYTDVLEATNSHEYKIEKGKEIWTKLK